jgi:hypothetical protein
MQLSRKIFVLFTLLAILCSTFVDQILTQKAQASDLNANAFFVAKDGDDSNDGSEIAPFATLEKARDAIRSLKTGPGLPEGGVTVYLREGNYQRTSSFELSGQDSGTVESPIVYRAFPGEEVSIMGGFELDGSAFEEVTDINIRNRLLEEAREHVVQVDLQQQGLTEYGELEMYGFSMINFPQGAPKVAAPELFFNGEVMTLARWPNEDYSVIHSVYEMGTVPRNYADDVVPGSPNYVPPEQRDDPWRGFTIGYAGDRPSRWTEANDLWMYGYWFYDWADQSVQVESIDTANRRIKAAQPSAYGIKTNQRYYVFNLLEEIDVPGEYYLDRENGILYLYPPEQMDGASVQLSVLDTDLIRIDNASSIQFENMYIGSSRKNAFYITHSSNIVINDVTMARLGYKAVVSEGGTGVKVLNSDIFDTGAGGISLDGGNRITLTPGGNVAENNHIHHFSRIVKTYTPAINISGVGNRAAHNLIHDGPHVAIVFTGNDQVIEYNEIFDVVQEAGDMGAIYTGRNWTYRGNVVRYNFIHDITGIGSSGGGTGVYLDDAMSSAEVTGNIFNNVYRAFHVGGGRDHHIENNLVINSTRSITLDNRAMNTEGFFSDFMDPVNGTMYVTLRAMPYETEPWSSRYPELAAILDDNPGIPAGNSIQRNVFIRSGVPSIASQAVQYGTVINNLSIDGEDNPGFVDAAQMDFNLRPDSMIWDQVDGFAEIPFDDIGLELNDYRTELPAVGQFDLLGSDNVDVSSAALSWGASSGASSYYLTVAKDAAFESVVTDRMVKGTSVNLTELEPGMTYYWKVRAVLGSDYAGGVWNSSGPAQFTTVDMLWGQPWTPANLDTNLWLDASDASSVTMATYKVSEWKDKSGNDRNATQEDAARQPTYDPEDGQMVFDGAQILKAPGDAFTFGASEVYVVADSSMSGNGTYVIGSTAGPGSVARLYLNRATDTITSAYVGRLDTSQKDNVNFGSAASRAIYGIESSHSPAPYDLRVRLNGDDVGSKLQYSSTYSGNLGNVYVGGRTSANTDNPSLYGGFMTGSVQEVIFTGVLSASNKLKMEGYLAHKWGLTDSLPESHPYKAFAPQITTYAALNAAISEAEALAVDAVAGTDPGQYPAEAISTFAAAIDTARAVASDGYAIQASIDAAVGALTEAANTFREAVHVTYGEITLLDDIIQDSAHWDDVNGKATFTEDGQLIVASDRTTIGYNGAKYKNELLTFKAKFNLDSGWQGFAIRAADTEDFAWSGNDQYLLVVKPDIIELQRWHSGQKFLQIIDNDYIHSGQWHTIQYGATEVAGGQTYITLKVDDAVVIHLLDDQPITANGYFSVYNMNSGAGILTLGPVEAEEQPEAEANLTADGTVKLVGQNVSLTVGVGDVDASFTALDVIVHYDPQKLEFPTVTNGSSVSLASSAIESLNSNFAIASAIKPELGQIRIIMTTASEDHAVTEASQMFMLHGKVRVDAAVGNTQLSLSDFEVSLGGSGTLLDVSNASAELEVVLADKAGLNTAINDALNVYDSAVEGTEAGQYPAPAKALLQAVITSAILVRDDSDATQTEVGDAIQALTSAIATFNQSVVPFVIADKAVLNAAITAAQSRYDRAVTGTKIGQYEEGAKEALEAAIAAAQAVSVNAGAIQTQADQAVVDLTNAVQTFSVRIVSLVEGATHISIKDLSIIAKYFGTVEGDPEWSEIEKADLFGNGEITIEVLAAVAQMILDDWLLG